MPRTPDRYPGVREETEIQMEEDTVQPSVAGAIKYVNGDFSMVDSSGVFNPRTGGSGLTSSQHRAEDVLVHLVAETAYYEAERNGSGRLTAITAYVDNTKSTKIRRVEITRVSGKVDTVVVRQYDGSGTEVETITFGNPINRVSGKFSNAEQVLT